MLDKAATTAVSGVPLSETTGFVQPESSNNDSWAFKFGVQDDSFIDDLTGLPLDPDLCRAERSKGLTFK